MKYLFTTLTLILITCIAFKRYQKKEIETRQEEPTMSIFEQFENLPKDQREEFDQGLVNAHKQFNQKQIFAALEIINELDKIFAGHPAALNLKGACYVETRDFEKARAIFKSIHRIAPENTNALFNLAEVDFVTKQWESAHERFTKLISMLPEEEQAILYLSQFKLLLCNLKTGRIEEAKAIRDMSNERNDSPIYYYSRAALLFHQGDNQGAEKTLTNARHVWEDNELALAAWHDTLIEIGYIESFYSADTPTE